MASVLYKSGSKTPLTKIFNKVSSGKIVKRSVKMPKFFDGFNIDFESINDLYQKVSALASTKDCIIVNGSYNDGDEFKRTQRLKKHFSYDTAPWICLDIDDAVGYSNNNEDVARYITEKLPVQFHDVSYVLQYSASATLEGHLKAHLFYMTDDSLNEKQLRTWLKNKVDVATLGVVQPIYIAEPVYENFSDDFGQRIHLVNLDLPHVDLPEITLKKYNDEDNKKFRDDFDLTEELRNEILNRVYTSFADFKYEERLIIAFALRNVGFTKSDFLSAVKDKASNKRIADGVFKDFDISEGNQANIGTLIRFFGTFVNHTLNNASDDQEITIDCVYDSDIIEYKHKDAGIDQYISQLGLDISNRGIHLIMADAGIGKSHLIEPEDGTNFMFIDSMIRLSEQTIETTRKMGHKVQDYREKVDMTTNSLAVCLQSVRLGKDHIERFISNSRGKKTVIVLDEMHLLASSMSERNSINRVMYRDFIRVMEIINPYKIIAMSATLHSETEQLLTEMKNDLNMDLHAVKVVKEYENKTPINWFYGDKLAIADKIAENINPEGKNVIISTTKTFVVDNMKPIIDEMYPDASLNVVTSGTSETYDKHCNISLGSPSMVTGISIDHEVDNFHVYFSSSMMTTEIIEQSLARVRTHHGLNANCNMFVYTDNSFIKTLPDVTRHQLHDMICEDYKGIEDSANELLKQGINPDFSMFDKFARGNITYTDGRVEFDKILYKVRFMREASTSYLRMIGSTMQFMIMMSTENNVSRRYEIDEYGYLHPDDVSDDTKNIITQHIEDFQRKVAENQKVKSYNQYMEIVNREEHDAIPEDEEIGIIKYHARVNGVDISNCKTASSIKAQTSKHNRFALFNTMFMLQDADKYNFENIIYKAKTFMTETTPHHLAMIYEYDGILKLLKRSGTFDRSMIEHHSDMKLKRLYGINPTPRSFTTLENKINNILGTKTFINGYNHNMLRNSMNGAEFAHELNNCESNIELDELLMKHISIDMEDAKPNATANDKAIRDEEQRLADIEFYNNVGYGSKESIPDDEVDLEDMINEILEDDTIW